jgi:hypothetical protein
MRASNSEIPSELRRKIAPAPLWFKDGERTFIRCTFSGLAALSLYGLGPLNHNGFVCVLGPWICPSIPAAFFTLLPPLPSRGVFLSRNWRGVDRTDPVVMRLVELYESREARRHLWKQALKLSGILFAIVGTAAIMLRNSLNWELPSSQNGYLYPGRGPGSWFWVGFVGCSLFSFVALAVDHVGWVIRTWASQEAAHHALEG